MEQYELLWQYQQVDMELDQYEKDVRQLAADRKLPNATVLRAYANSWEDEELGKEIANQMIGKGADVLFIYANKVGNGCIDAAKEME